MVGDINDNESDFKSNIDDIEFNSLSTSCKKIYLIYFILSNEDLENVSVDTFSYNSDLLHCMSSNKLISILVNDFDFEIIEDKMKDDNKRLVDLILMKQAELEDDE